MEQRQNTTNEGREGSSRPKTRSQSRSGTEPTDTAQTAGQTANPRGTARQASSSSSQGTRQPAKGTCNTARRDATPIGPQPASDTVESDDAATVTGPPAESSSGISPDYVDAAADLGFRSPEDMEIETDDYRTYRTKALEEARLRYQEQTEYVSTAIQEVTTDFQERGVSPSPVEQRLLEALQVQHNQIVQAHEILNDTVNQIISGAQPEDVFSVLPAQSERSTRAPAPVSTSSSAQIEAELRDGDYEEEYEELPRLPGEDVESYRGRKAAFRRRQKSRARDPSPSPSISVGSETQENELMGQRTTTAGQSVSAFLPLGRGRGGPPFPPRAGWMKRLRANGRPMPVVHSPTIQRQTPPHMYRARQPASPIVPSVSAPLSSRTVAPPVSTVRFAPISATVTQAATPSQHARNVLVGNRQTPRFIDSFVEAGLERLATQIQRVLGRPLPNSIMVPRNAAKPPPPTSYKGQNSHEAFETWANALIRYL